MKIIEAARHGELSYVQVKQGNVVCTMQKEGELICIYVTGRGNVRFAKHQAKLIHHMLNG
ncbi:hypothetical protein SRABI106_01469 [Rahnella aquatilis]|nr:hypothetical protein SRABI106_01469 [Rahnella aquatilis]